jgi:hypothetical protein
MGRENGGQLGALADAIVSLAAAKGSREGAGERARQAETDLG